MLTRRVDLCFPIHTPQGVISSVTLRPMTAKQWEDGLPSIRAQLELVADSAGLPLEVIMEMDEADHEVVITVLGDVSIEGAEELRSGPPKGLRVIQGGRA